MSEPAHYEQIGVETPLLNFLYCQNQVQFKVDIVELYIFSDLESVDDVKVLDFILLDFLVELILLLVAVKNPQLLKSLLDFFLDLKPSIDKNKKGHFIGVDSLVTELRDVGYAPLHCFSESVLNIFIGLLLIVQFQ